MLDFGEELFAQEDVLEVIKDLSHSCYDCRLGHCQSPKNNRGLVWRGSPNAKMALVSIMPGPKEMETGKPLTGKSGELADIWFKSINIDTNTDMLVINVVQCKPPDVEKEEGEISQREPENDELSVCFPSRCLRVLRAMPNLEAIITLGWSAAKCILGGSANEVTHMGHWYSTSMLPHKIVYCLPHPAALLRDKEPTAPALERKYKVMKCLNRLQRSYNKAISIVKEGK